MSPVRRERGMALIVALVMLIVLTLLVVSAIRFGTINLKITGNAQSEAEAAAAAQVAIETTINTINATPDISTLPQEVMNVSTGGTSYAVTVEKPGCIFNKNINNADLDPTKASDQACFEGNDTEKIVTAGNTLTTTPTACRDQQWDVRARVDDNKSGVKTSLLQGVSVRVGAQVDCP